MNINDVEAFGVPSGAPAIGIVRWLAHDTQKRVVNEVVDVPGVERTDYLVKTSDQGFQYVGHGTPATWVRWDQVVRAKVWYW